MGNSKERFDSEGQEKVMCRLCSRWYHRVDLHVQQKHTTMTLERYKETFPGSELISPTALEMLREARSSREEIGSDDEPFKFGVATLNARTELDEYDQKFVPQHDEKWEDTPMVKDHLECLALAMQDDDNCLIVGPPGIGKTTLAKELAAITNNPLRRLPFNGDMRLLDFVGGERLAVHKATKRTVTVFRKGPLVDSAERGHWLLFDEFDSAPPPIMFVLHPFMESPRQLVLMSLGAGHEVEIDSRTRVIATANTIGYGDESGLLAGTGPLNEALLDRFGMIIKMGYPPNLEERKILTGRTGVSDHIASKMIDVATKVREAQGNNVTVASLSPRRLIMWGNKAIRFNDVKKAAMFTIVNRVPPTDSKFISDLIQRVFGTGIVRPS